MQSNKELNIRWQ